MARRLVPLRPVLAARPARPAVPRAARRARDAVLAPQLPRPLRDGDGARAPERLGRRARGGAAGPRRDRASSRVVLGRGGVLLLARVLRGRVAARPHHAVGQAGDGAPAPLRADRAVPAPARGVRPAGPQPGPQVPHVRAHGVPRARVVRDLPLARGVDRPGVLVVRLHAVRRADHPRDRHRVRADGAHRGGQLLPRRAARAALQGPAAVARRRASRSRRRRHEPGRARRRHPTPRSRHGWRPSPRTPPIAACPSSPTARTSRVPTGCAPSRR